MFFYRSLIGCKNVLSSAGLFLFRKVKDVLSTSCFAMIGGLPAGEPCEYLQIFWRPTPSPLSYHYGSLNDVKTFQKNPERLLYSLFCEIDTRT